MLRGRGKRYTKGRRVQVNGRKVTSSRSGLQEVPQDFEEKVAEAETEQLVDQRESDDGTRSSKAVNHPSH